MGNAYTYYSYEEYGRGYIGARSKSPIGDDAYMGSFKDKSFNPTQKIILAEFSSMEEAIEVEVALHNYFDVAENPHFANRAKQTSSGFSRAGSTDSTETIERKRLSHTGVIHSKERKENQSKGWTEQHRKRKGVQARESLTGKPKVHLTNKRCLNQRQAGGS